MIAATNRDLLEEVRKGRFREDLYYRLNVFPIRCRRCASGRRTSRCSSGRSSRSSRRAMGKKITQVPRRTMEALQRQRWPGNVRELRNVIERAAILTSGDTLDVPALEAPAAAGGEQTLAEAERQLILRTLEGKRWRVKGPAGAAATLGINPSTLYSRMKKLGIRAPGRGGED